MRREDVVGNAADLLHLRADAASVLQDLQIRAGSAEEVLLEQADHHRRQEERVDPNQRCRHGFGSNQKH